MFDKIALPALTPRNETQEDEDKRRLIESLVDCGSLKLSLARCNVSMETSRRWRLDDEEFAREFDLALRDGTRLALESAGIERALHSSDVLLMFFLKALDRDTYDDAVARTKQEKKGITIKIVDQKAKA